MPRTPTAMGERTSAKCSSLVLPRGPTTTPPPDRIVSPPGGGFPRTRTPVRFKDSNAANHFPSANRGLVYRDDLFGPAFDGNSFVSEPVHNLVHREIMTPEGLTFASRRADDEQDCEFLAS